MVVGTIILAVILVSFRITVFTTKDNTICVSFIDVGQRLEYMLSNYFQRVIDKRGINKHGDPFSEILLYLVTG